MHIYMAPISDDSGGDELRILKAAAHKNKSRLWFCILCG